MSVWVVDAGNSRVKLGCYESVEPGARLLANLAIENARLEELERELRPLARPTVVVGCEVSGLRERIERVLANWAPAPTWHQATSALGGLKNGYEAPERLGSDRWFAMVGALRHLHASSRAAVVVMAGTAVTIDAIENGTFVGGLIVPGFDLMLRALAQGTARLAVPEGEVTPFPTRTPDALMSGASDAIAGAIERVTRRLEQRVGVPPEVLVSGGAAPRVSALLTGRHRCIETLVFEGLLTAASLEAQ